MADLFRFLLGFRKLTVMLLFLITMILFRIFNYIDGAQFAENLQLAVVAFFGANIGEHLLNLGKEFIKSKLKDNNDNS